VGWLTRWDERNPGTSNWLMDHPKAGTEVRPFARSPKARLVLALLIGAAIVLGFLFGLVAWIVVLPLVAIASWRLEVHPGRDRYKRSKPTTPPS